MFYIDSQQINTYLLADHERRSHARSLSLTS